MRPSSGELVAEIRERHDTALRCLVQRHAQDDTIAHSACAHAWSALVDAEHVDLQPPRWSALAWVTTAAMHRAYQLAGERGRTAPCHSERGLGSLR